MRATRMTLQKNTHIFIYFYIFFLQLRDTSLAHDNQHHMQTTSECSVLLMCSAALGDPEPLTLCDILASLLKSILQTS